VKNFESRVVVMDCVTLLSNAFCSGAGAFAGGLAAYYFAVRKDKQRQIADYLNLLLLIYSELDSLHSLFKNIPDSYIKEIDGEKVVAFDMPFPEFSLSSQQMLTLLDVSPDKQMVFGLIGMKHFLETHAQRVMTDGVNVLSLNWIRQQEKQLSQILLSLRVQYEQETNSEFPFYEITLNELSQKKPQNQQQS